MTTPTEPKRNSGRTGRRRLSPEETALRGNVALAKYNRRYGMPSVAALPALPNPPAWFTPDLVGIWCDTTASVAPGALSAVDTGNLTAYCLALLSYRRLARELLVEPVPTAALERRLQLAGIELGRASKVLGIQPADRVKIPAAPVPKEPLNELLRFDVILPDGRRVPGPGKRPAKAN
jgi:hypothetical protein